MFERSPLFHPFLHQDEQKKSRKHLRWIVFFLLVVFGLSFGFWRLWQKSFLPETARELKRTVSLAPGLLGYDRPRTYLVLFLNNAEIRPGGGFIGSYGLVKLDKGKILSFETRGSENLDWEAPDDFKIEPPEPIKIYLNQPRWYFRDANWSPDFPQSSQKAIWFYRFEGGKDGSKIDGVIALTPVVLEELMKVSGPVVVGDKIFQAENIIDKLQYQVEIGFQKEGKLRSERKSLVGDLGRALLSKLQTLPPAKWKELYFSTLKMLGEKQMMIYSADPNIESALRQQGWAGDVKQTDGDYLMLVDANLIGLKSDPAVKRSISYQVRRENGRLRAKVAVLYDHRGRGGEPDWKIGRYRDYARLYVPKGSELISSDGFIETDKIKKGEQPVAKPAVVNTELDKTVFGGFLFVNPNQQKILTLEYYLPDFVAEQASKGSYTLFVQKQLGTIAHGLTINLDFGKKTGQDGNDVFKQETDLRVDRQFTLNSGF